MGVFSEPEGCLRLSIAMDFQMQTGFGSASVQWISTGPASGYDEITIKISAVCLLYGRVLATNARNRDVLFYRVGRIAETLINPPHEIFIETWGRTVPFGRKIYHIWPWQIVPREFSSAKAKRYVVILRILNTGKLSLYLKIPWGFEHVLAPAAALIAILCLETDLDLFNRAKLGYILSKMNEFYGSPKGSRGPFAEDRAFDAALVAAQAVSQGLSAP